MTERSKHKIRDGITISVASGLILAGILWFVGRLGSVASWILDRIVNLGELAWKPITLPAVVIVAGGGFIGYHVVRGVRIFLAHRRTSTYVLSPEPPDAAPARAVEAKPDPIGELAQQILKFFARAKESRHSLRTIMNTVNATELRATAALDRLIGQDLVNAAATSYMGPTAYSLTNAGREFVINKRLDQQPDDEEVEHYG